MAATEKLAADVGSAAACRAMGVARSTFYRRRKPSRPTTSDRPLQPDEVYFQKRPANQSPRFEPRALWPRSAPCALPQVLVKGQPGVRIELELSNQHSHKHLPVAAVRRAA